ncbi:DUF4199 domain-containing protein [Foetidibacter luteolus]|uniref:DUF4199 domain-containing protein n=1 Tax=Foetidibacter luteolus TaxID=2608880 RepID=UPI00129ABEA8|nr:DUF4199 domain-containing protein [Foetidibacter luteolus]
MKDIINSYGIKFGIINGLIAAGLMFGTWAAGLDVFVTYQFASSFIPFMIVILIIAGLNLRRNNGGVLPFKDALRFAFLSYVIAAVIYAIGNYILFNLVDKELTEKAFNLSLEKTKLMMEKLKTSDEEIEKTLEKAREGKGDTGFKTIFLGFGIGLIWDFVKSLLIAIIIRKEKPVFNEQ